MNRFIRLSIGALAIAVATVVVRADVPHVYAIKGARIVTAAGAPIPSGTVLVRNGLIEAVGADVTVPATATVIDGAGLTVYPGLIDMGNSTGVDAATPPAPQTFRTTEEAERFAVRPTSVLASRPRSTYAPTRRSWPAWPAPASRASLPRRRVASSRGRARSSTSSVQ